MRFKIEERARQQGKTESSLKLVGLFLLAGKQLILGSNNVDALHDRIKAAYPDAKISKHKNYVQVEAK